MTGRKSFLKISSIYIVVSSLLCNQTAYAVLGFGDIVADPGSYAYYVEQIAVATDQVSEMKKAVSTADDTLDSIDDMKETAEKAYKNVKGKYYQAQRYMDKYKKVQAMLDKTPRSLEGKYKKWMELANLGVNKADKAVNLYEDPEKTIDVMYKDPRSSLYDHQANMDRRYEIEQTALKNSISEAEKVIAGTKDRMKNLEILNAEMEALSGKDGNMKLAQDHTNNLLSEIILILDQLLILTAHMAEAESLMAYNGIDEDVTTERMASVNSRAQRAAARKKSFLRILKAKNAECDRNNTFSEDTQNW